MLEAGDGQPPSHLSQLRSAEQAPVACASSREVQTRGSNTMICGDKQRLKKSRVFLIDRFGQGHSTSWTFLRLSPARPLLASVMCRAIRPNFRKHVTLLSSACTYPPRA